MRGLVTWLPCQRHPSECVMIQGFSPEREREREKEREGGRERERERRQDSRVEWYM